MGVGVKRLQKGEYNAGMLYHQTLARAARFFPHRVAVVDGERRVSYGELAVRVEQLAGLLASLGFAAGDRLAFLLPNSLEFVEFTFACCRLGVMAVPLNTRFSAAELDEALRDAEPRGFVRHPTLPKPSLCSASFLLETPPPKLFAPISPNALPASRPQDSAQPSPLRPCSSICSFAA